MPRDDTRFWLLLRALDDPDHVEFPAGHDHRRARDRFDALARRIDADFGASIVVRDVQDAAFHGRIVVPAAVATGAAPVVTISNFGGLAALGTDPLASTHDPPHAVDARAIGDALDAHGYTLIPGELLGRPYDGAGDLARLRPGDPPPTWWTRYFDYL